MGCAAPGSRLTTANGGATLSRHPHRIITCRSRSPGLLRLARCHPSGLHDHQLEGRDVGSLARRKACAWRDSRTRTGPGSPFPILRAFTHGYQCDPDNGDSSHRDGNEGALVDLFRVDFGLTHLFHSFPSMGLAPFSSSSRRAFLFMFSLPSSLRTSPTMAPASRWKAM